jgi:hypothetical protein
MAANEPEARRPEVWRMPEPSIAEFAEQGLTCEYKTEPCSERAVIVTQRTRRYRGLVWHIERFMCERHGTQFGERYGVPVDPAPECEARHLTAPEMAGCAARGQACAGVAGFACQAAPTCLLTDRYIRWGESKVEEYLACDQHAAVLSRSRHISIAPAPDEGGSR